MTLLTPRLAIRLGLPLDSFDVSFEILAARYRARVHPALCR